MTKEALRRLKNNLRGEVHVDTETRELASTDASIFKIVPDVVVAPKNTRDIEHIVRFVNEERRGHSAEGCALSITPRAGGTDMSGGPLSCSLVLDMMPHFQGVEHFDASNLTATVLPGTYYRDFREVTEAEGCLLPCYTASWRVNTLGGMVGNNSGGEKTLTYGKTEKYITELKMVFSDGNEYLIRPLSKSELEDKIAQDDFEGNVYRELFELIEDNYDKIQKAKPNVSKNSAGYYLWNAYDRATGVFDLNKLIVGSQGTLGVVTSITTSLVKPKTHSTLLIIFLKDLRSLATIINKVLEQKPESFESYDDHTAKIALKFFPSMVKLMGAGNVFKLAWQFLPEMKMVLTGGLPKMVLEAEFTGDSEEEVYDKAYRAQASLEDFHVKTRVTKNDYEEDKYWTVRRQSFALLRHHVHGKHTAPFIDDICIRPEKLPAFLPALEEIMDEYDITYTIAGHVGDGNFHIIPLMNYKRPDFKEIIVELSSAVYDLVIENEGTIDGEHNDGLIRTPYLKKMYGEEITELFRKTKHIFDPLNIFNPGKKVGGTIEENLKFVKKE